MGSIKPRQDKRRAQSVPVENTATRQDPTPLLITVKSVGQGGIRVRTRLVAPRAPRPRRAMRVPRGNIRTRQDKRRAIPVMWEQIRRILVNLPAMTAVLENTRMLPHRVLVKIAPSVRI